MQVDAALSVFIEQEQSKFMLVGSATKTMDIASVEEAEEEGREWIRRNRLSNSDGPALRYRVELSRNGCTLWEYDETRGDVLLEPTENTVVACPIYKGKRSAMRVADLMLLWEMVAPAYIGITTQRSSYLESLFSLLLV